MTPHPGDLRYPTFQGGAFVIALAALLTTGLYLWLDRWWLFLVFSIFVAYYLAANLWTVRHWRAQTTVLTSDEGSLPAFSESIIPSGLFEGAISPFHREQVNWALMVSHDLRDDRYEEFFHMGYKWVHDLGGQGVALNAAQLKLVQRTAPYYSGAKPIPAETRTPGIPEEQEPIWFLVGGFCESNKDADQSATLTARAAARRVFDDQKVAASDGTHFFNEEKAFELFTLGACFVDFERALVAELQ